MPCRGGGGLPRVVFLLPQLLFLFRGVAATAEAATRFDSWKLNGHFGAIDHVFMLHDRSVGLIVGYEGESGVAATDRVLWYLDVENGTEALKVGP